MKLLSQVVVSVLQGTAAVCLCTPALSQIRQIDPSKIPQNSSIQAAYNDLLPIDQYARSYEATWHFPISKGDVVSRFEMDLRVLQNAQLLNPDNEELRVLTGLAAHLAYNLDIEDAYDPPFKLLQPLATDDFRAAWFLGIHQCQSNNPVGGMQRLLSVEASTPNLPGAFWLDYANCASVANMPVHAIRAYDLARKAGDGTTVDEQMEKTVRDRLVPSSITSVYPIKQSWSQFRIVGGTRYTSNICGQAFSAKPHLHLSISDVTHGTCPITIDTEPYPSRYGPSSASLLLLTQVARPGESLDAFANRILESFSQGKVKKRDYSNQTGAAGIICPVRHCLTYESVTDKLYKNEGGAHLLAVFFQSDQPEYPGLIFETPQPLPKNSQTSHQPAFFPTDEIMQRYSGTLYTFITLDSNQDIYPRARADFDELFKSLVIDTKVDSQIESPAP
jgi:hypothetical protein